MLTSGICSFASATDRKGNRDNLGIIFHFFHKNIFFDPSLEPSCLIKLRKLIFELSSISPLIWNSALPFFFLVCLFQNNHKNLDLSHKLDLDLMPCLRGEKLEEFLVSGERACITLNVSSLMQKSALKVFCVNWKFTNYCLEL